MTKFYTPLHQSSQTVIEKIFSLIHSRPPTLCNFLDAPELEAFLGPKDEAGERWQVVYRNYATLYFVFVVDGAESELGILDLIQVRIPLYLSSHSRMSSLYSQVFVESLDRAFENVCELDLVFHFDEVSNVFSHNHGPFPHKYHVGSSYSSRNYTRWAGSGNKRRRNRYVGFVISIRSPYLLIYLSLIPS